MILAAVPDLLFRTRIAEAARAQSVEIRFAREPEALAADAPFASLVLVDLDGASYAVEAVRRAAPEVRIVGFYSHVHEERRERALAAGCTEVLPRGQFVRRIAEIVGS